MSSSEPTISDIQRSVRHAVRLHWHLFLAQGIIMTILGVLAVIWPQISTVAVDVYVGWLFLLSGAVGLVTIFFVPTVCQILWSPLTAALTLFVGILLLWHPVEGAISLTLVLVAFFIVEGIFQIAASLGYREAFPQLLGMDAGKRHRRPGLGGCHHRGMAGDCELGPGADCRRQPHHLGHCDHNGSNHRATCSQDGRKSSAVEFLLNHMCSP